MANKDATSAHAKILDEFRAVDSSGSGRIEMKQMLRTLASLGFASEESLSLLDASDCVARHADGEQDVNYDAFIKWLVCTNTSEITGCESPVLPSGFGSWVDKCARVLEARDEANCMQKKQMSAQVHAHLQSMEEIETLQAALIDTGSAAVTDTPLAVPTPETQPLRFDGPALVDQLIRKGPNTIPVDFVDQVLDAVATVLPQQYPRPLVRLRVPLGGRYVVVGDTHGQLQDVLLIMLLHGLPSALNCYLFNGDVADRGPNACEIFMLIFVFMLTNPSTVLMIRGNHEDDQMNMRPADESGGFYDECLLKYGERTYWKFVEVFKLLPLAAVVHNEVFIVHGGLPSKPVHLDQIEAVNCRDVCCPAPDTSSSEEQLFMDLLWSDPMETPGHEPNPRGAGLSMWGPDITKAFLAKNQLSWIIRSHELPWDGERGWMEHHLGLVFTLFSASNYTGLELNWGAVSLLTVGADGRIEQALREHNIANLDILAEVADVEEGVKREERCRDIGLSWVDSDRVAVGERRFQLALRRLAGIVLELKPELWQDFRRSDPENTGTITRTQWIDALINVCGDDLPWEEASKCWVPANTQNVDYRRFLDRFKIILTQEKWCGWKSLVIADVYEELLSRNAGMQDILRTIDPSGDGIVSVDDFMQLMNECSGGHLSEPQIAALSRTIFAQAQGRGLRLSSFLSRFTVAFVQSKGMSAAENHSQCPLASIGPTMEQIGKLIIRARSENNLAVTLQPLKLERYVSHPAGTSKDRPSFGRADSESLLLPPPPLGLGRAISEGPPPPPMLGLVREQSCGLGLIKTFERWNDSGGGLLQTQEFVEHILALPGIEDVRHKGKPLDEAAVQEIAEIIADSDGTINLLQFARAFAVVDASGSTDLADDLHEHILTFLYRHRDTLRSSCARRDRLCSGRVCKRDFARVLEAVNFCTARPARHLTQVQMSVLVESIVEDDGYVDHDSFLNAFEVNAG